MNPGDGDTGASGGFADAGAFGVGDIGDVGGEFEGGDFYGIVAEARAGGENFVEGEVLKRLVADAEFHGGKRKR